MERSNCAWELVSGVTIMIRRILPRRNFLITAAFAAFFISRANFAAGCRRAPRAASLGASRLTSVFQRKRSARAVGEAYLRRAPEEADPVLLVNAICDRDRGLRQVLHHGDNGRLRAAINNRLRRDFAHGRTVMLDGWLLSRTEARLCALTAIA